MPDFVDLLHFVIHFGGFAEFDRAPGPTQNALVVRMGASVRLVVKRLAHLFFHASAAERYHQFIVVSVGKDGVEGSKQREDIDVGYPEVLTNVWVFGTSDDLRVHDRALGVLVDPGLEGRDVHVLDLFSYGGVCLVVQGGGIGSSAEEGVPGF